jgi:hypothetical protein
VARSPFDSDFLRLAFRAKTAPQRIENARPAQVVESDGELVLEQLAAALTRTDLLESMNIYP